MKKLNVFLIAAFLVAGCASVPSSLAENDGEETSASEVALKLDTREAKREEAKQKLDEEYAKLVDQKPAQPQKATANQECKINGYDCWKIAQLFKLGTENDQETRTAKLKKMGLTVTFSTMYRDGGSWDYQLSDGTRIHVTNSIWDRSGDMKIMLPGGQIFQYDAQGNRK